MKLNSALINKNDILDITKDIYSTTEVKTNEIWNNGKPIYQKFYYISKDQTSSTSINVNNDISNFGELVKISGTIFRNNGAQNNIPNANPNADWSSYFSDTDTTYFRIRLGGSLYNQMDYIKFYVKYTKTTD